MLLECATQIFVLTNNQKRNSQDEIEQNLNNLLNNHPTFKKKEQTYFYIPTSILQPSANLNTDMCREFGFCKHC